MTHDPTTRSAPLQLAVVVLNYKTPDLVVDCLRSLDGQIDAGTQEVVIVDNCSGDDSPDLIEQAIESNAWGNWARLIRSPINGGFAAGNNVGIKASDAQLYILLNSDTLVREGAIRCMLDTLDAHPDIAMLGPRLEWADGQQQVSTFRYRKPLTELLYASNLGLIWKLFPQSVVARPMDEYAQGLDWVSYACVAIRKEIFDRAGLLDESYFMYFEDMAHCRAATRAGFKIAFDPAARVAHLQGGSSTVPEQTKQRKRRPAYYYAARAHYFQTFYGLPGRWLANAFWILGWTIGKLRGKTGAVEHEFSDIWASPVHKVGGAHKQ